MVQRIATGYPTWLSYPLCSPWPFLCGHRDPYQWLAPAGTISSSVPVSHPPPLPYAYRKGVRPSACPFPAWDQATAHSTWGNAAQGRRGLPRAGLC